MSLALRKDVKLGLGIGTGLLAVGGLYAMMSIYGPSGNTQTATSENGKPATEVVAVPTTPSVTTDKPATAEKETPKPAPLPNNEIKHDPFAESARTDGDVAQVSNWDTLLNSGAVPTGTNTVVRTTTPTIPTNVPTGPTVDGHRVFADPDANDVPKSVTDNTKTSTTIEPAAVASGKYIVQPGDTFSSIAGKLYGNKNLYHVLVKANPTIDPTRLKPKMEIVLPPAADVKVVRGSLASNEEVSKVIDTTREYRIQTGDTLHSIALRLYGKSSMWTSIYDANQTKIGPDAGKIKVGMILTLPKAPQTH